MQHNQHPTQADYKLNDIVFALKTNKEVWPAKITKVLSEDTFQIKFYMLRRHIKVSTDQIWPFNSQTCQRFVTQKSTSFFCKVVEMAKKHIQKQTREEEAAHQNEENPEQEELNRSFIEDTVNFQVESSHIEIPFSLKRGLFVIEEVHSKLQISQENSSPQYLSSNSNSKRHVSRGRNQVELVVLQKQREESGRRYQTRSQMRKKNRRAKRASLMAQKQKQNAQQFDRVRFQVGESLQQISNFINPEIEQAATQENIDQFIPQEFTHTNAQPEIYEHVERSENNAEQNQQQSNPSQPQFENTQQENQPQPNNQNLVFYGPIDIVDLSTQASFHSIHTIPAWQANSTMASSNDISHNQSDKQNQQQFRFEQTHSQSNQSSSSSCTEDYRQLGDRLNQDEIQEIIVQFLDKLQRVVVGEHETLRPQEQLKLSRTLEAFRQTEMENKRVLRSMVQFVTLFEESRSISKQYCYMQYTLIRSHLQIKVLLNKSQPSSSQPQICEILENFQSRKTSPK